MAMGKANDPLVAQRQQQAGESVEIHLADLGGEKGLKTTLRNFYMDIVRSIQPIQSRKRVRRLCEQYLISPEGRRLSLEESEIQRILKLGRSTLQQLVNGRLLRTDQRADSWYYELSHDSLIEPILTTRRMRGIVFGLSGLLGSVLVGITAFGAIFIGLLGIWGLFVGLYETPAQKGMSLEELKMVKAFSALGFLIFFGIGGLLGWAALKGIRACVETLNRYVPPPA